MKIPAGLRPWLAPAGFVAARLALAPKTYNTHAIMYPVVAELGGQNTLELFHPLYVPLLKTLNALRHAAGFPGPSIHLYQALSLAGAALHLRLLYALAEDSCKEKKTALYAALLATASVNLWAWSLQTMPYTLATTAALACLLRLRRKAPAWKVGALAGLTMGFDTAGLALLPVCLLELKPLKSRAAFLAGAAAAAAACYFPFLAIGRSLPSGPGALLQGLPFDIISLAASHSVAAQARDWLASTAPVDAPWLLLAALFVWGAASLPRGRAPLVLFAAVSAFFFAADPHNRFLYAGAMLWPVVAAALAERRRLAAPVCAALWLALAAKNIARPPDYLPKDNASFDEAAFVADKLGPRGLLVSVSQPDLLFAYAYQDQGELAKPGDDSTGDLVSHAADALAAGRPVWLAGDALFRDSRVPPEEMDARIASLLSDLKRVAALQAPVVSPHGEYFYPLSKKR